jgi:UDP-glucose 4-epimerase
MNVLVTGGAGYIGSHAVKALVAGGHRVVVLDNLFRGHRAAVHPQATFCQGDVADTPLVERLLGEHQVECVLHFAAKAYVGESVAMPLEYYRTNLGGTLSLLAAMQKTGVKRLVFSSTAATYGVPDELPILETTPQVPCNPYGWSKRFVEQVLLDHARAHSGFGAVAFRYFNVAGCAADGSLGEDHTPETHLVPAILQAVLGLRPAIVVFGRDYPTPDGTCIRDYLHVEDLCEAHIQAINSIQPGEVRFYNLGIGRGYSVLELIESARRVTRRPIPVEDGPRRAGDPPSLYANADRANRELAWKPRYLELDRIVETAWQWFETHPHGYGDPSVK